MYISARVQCQCLVLEEYRWKIVYIPSKNNDIIDSLLRIGINNITEDTSIKKTFDLKKYMKIILIFLLSLELFINTRNLNLLHVKRIKISILQNLEKICNYGC